MSRLRRRRWLVWRDVRIGRSGLRVIRRLESGGVARLEGLVLRREWRRWRVGPISPIGLQCPEGAFGSQSRRWSAS